MLVNFTTKAYAGITMFGDDAITLLKMMGHSGTVPSAILAADVPAALNRLTTALDKQKEPPPTQDSDNAVVSMNHRALPMLDLLTAAAKENADVMWK